MACLFTFFDMPLPWLLGPMLSTVLLKIKYLDKVDISIKIRNAFLMVLGYNIGANITLEACQGIVNQFAGISSSTLIAVFASLLLAWWTSKNVEGISFASSAIGNMPGGLTPMMLICENIPKANLNVVVVLQSIRLMGTIAVIPFLLSHGFGASSGEIIVVSNIQRVFADVPYWSLIVVALFGGFVGYILNLPAKFLLGPILTTGAFAVYSGLPLQEAPHSLIAIAQLVTGIYLGACVDPVQFKQNAKLIPYALVGIVVLILTSLTTGYFLSLHYGFSLATAFLACAPGGIAEMCIAGMVMGENVSVILSYQLFRLLFLNFVMPIALKWYFNKYDSY